VGVAGDIDRRRQGERLKAGSCTYGAWACWGIGGGREWVLIVRVGGSLGCGGRVLWAVDAAHSGGRSGGGGGRAAHRGGDVWRGRMVVA